MQSLTSNNVSSSSSYPSSSTSSSSTTKRFCLIVFLFQISILLSCIILLYLTSKSVINLDGFRAAASSQDEEIETINDSEFNPEPVQCFVNSAEIIKDKVCNYDNKDDKKVAARCWNSFMGWPAKSKESTKCPRIFVSVREKGNDLRFEGCEEIETFKCKEDEKHFIMAAPESEVESADDHTVEMKDKPLKYCYAGDCAGMTGLFNCTIIDPSTASPDSHYGAQCQDISSSLECMFSEPMVEVGFVAAGPRNCKYRPSCLNLDGIYQCDNGNCTKIDSANCRNPKLDLNKDIRRCYRGDCALMTGVFNCTEDDIPVFGSQCRDISSFMNCSSSVTNEAERKLNDTLDCKDKNNCFNLSGIYICNNGNCSKSNEGNCVNRCARIQSNGKPILIRSADTVISANCKSVKNINTGQEIWSGGHSSSLLISCTDLPYDSMYINALTAFSGSFELFDCLNGTILQSGGSNGVGNAVAVEQAFRQNSTLTYAELQVLHNNLVEEGLRARNTSNDTAVATGPLLTGETESELMIYRNTRLHVYYEECFNRTSIPDICEDLHHGYCGNWEYLPNPGAKFRCLYSTNSSAYVKAEF